MNVFAFVLLSLAVWRITKMLTVDEGPFGIFQKIRDAANGHPMNPLFCFKCTSVWVAFFLALFFGLYFVEFIFYWLASSTVAIIVESFLDR